MKYKNIKKIDTRDNTSLNFNDVTYKLNNDTYKAEKQKLFIGNILLILLFIVLIFLVKNTIWQTFFATILGGLFSLLIWIITIRYQDTINFELDTLDFHILEIENYINQLNNEINSIDILKNKVMKIDNNNYMVKIVKIFTVMQQIQQNKNIIKSKEIKFINIMGEEIEFDDFIEQYSIIFSDKEKVLNIYQKDPEKFNDMMDYNYWQIIRQLSDLKWKLIRMKYYIRCGNAPEEYK